MNQTHPTITLVCALSFTFTSGDYSVSESEESEEKDEQRVKQPELNLQDLSSKLEIEKKRQEAGLELVVNPERKGD